MTDLFLQQFAKFCPNAPKTGLYTTKYFAFLSYFVLIATHLAAKFVVRLEAMALGYTRKIASPISSV